MLLVYSLAKVIDEVKCEVKEISSSKDELKDEEKMKLSLFRNLKFKMFLIAVVAECIEVIVDFKVDKKKIAFTDKFAGLCFSLCAKMGLFLNNRIIIRQILSLCDCDEHNRV